MTHNEEFIKGVVKDRVYTLGHLNLDLVWYDKRIDELEDEDVLRDEKAKLMDSMEKDKKQNPIVNDANKKIGVEAAKVEVKINLVATLKQSKKNTLDKIADFTAYLEVLKDMPKEVVDINNKLFEQWEEMMPSLKSETASTSTD